MGPNEILDKSVLVTAPTPLFHVVKQTGIEQGEVTDAAGGAWLGVAQEQADELDVANGRHLRVRLEGISACIAGEALDFDDLVVAAADGRVVKGTGRVVGIVRTPGAVGDHVSVQLTPGAVASA